MSKSNYKIINTLETNSDGSRLDKYWQEEGFKKFYKSFRKGVDLPKTLKNIPNTTLGVQNRYKLRGFQFGNWLTVEDRYNYLAACFVCLYDLNKVLKFKNNNLGLDGALGIALGSRGSSGAAAHFESSTNIINMTRYKSYVTDILGNKIKLPKDVLFKNTGGVGSFAHEYGHFLDYEFGSKFEIHNSYYSLTNGRSTSQKKIPYGAKFKMRNIIEEILSKAFYDAKGNKSNYMKRLERKTDNDYWFRRNEVFARLFEQKIGYELSKMTIKNTFLVQQKYNKNYYLNDGEMRKISPLFDRLFVEMRKYF